MNQMRLKLNTDKTEFLLTGHAKQLKKCHIEEISLDGDMIPRSEVVRCLGAFIDQNLDFSQ